MFSLIPPTYVVETNEYNGNNNLFRIKMKKGITRGATVYAQERREWGIVATIFALTTAAGGTLGAFLGIPYLALPFAAVGMMSRKIPFLQRYIEVQGHAAEIAAEKFYSPKPDIVKSVTREAKALADPSYGSAFKGSTQEGREAALRDALPKADKWVDRHDKTILKYKAKYG